MKPNWKAYARVAYRRGYRSGFRAGFRQSTKKLLSWINDFMSTVKE